MSKHLLINGGTENWRLADTVDLEGLRLAIEAAMQSGEILQMPVLLADAGSAPVTLLLNPAAAAAVALVEL
jgi:hypothetical protein